MSKDQTVSKTDVDDAMVMLGAGYGNPEPQKPKKEYKIDGKPSTIFRVKNRQNPYVMIDRRPIDNPNLSFKAKGILTYLMSRPDGWEVNITDLMQHGKEGAAAIRTGLRELRDARHVCYLMAREAGRITGWIIEVYEIPYDLPLGNDEAVTEDQVVPDCDFLHVENLQVENRRQVLNNLSSIKDRDMDPVAVLLSDFGFRIGPDAPFYLQDWRNDFPGQDNVIIQAVNEAHRRGVTSLKYVDVTLRAWKSNGVPPTREEMKAKSKPKQSLSEFQSALIAWANQGAT